MAAKQYTYESKPERVKKRTSNLYPQKKKEVKQPGDRPIQRARVAPGPLTPDQALQLQSAIGNRAVGRLLAQAPEPTVHASELTVERQPNRTGLPDDLKAGIENLSGYSMDDVRVHYNSSKPAKLNALAYTQGTEIHVGPGQERHLPHEAWHVVQQKQGRVKSTSQVNGLEINADEALETEAARIGPKAIPQKTLDLTTADLSIQKVMHPAHSLLNQPIQRTAWEKTGKGWERRPYEEGKYERDTPTEKTPPPDQIGKIGWHYSSTTNAYYESYDAYKSAIQPHTEAELPPGSDKSPEAVEKRKQFNAEYERRPTAQEGSIMTTSLAAEEDLLKRKSGSIEFSEDVTHNYLLWSVPKYTGENLKKETGTSLEDVSGEAKAEVAVGRKEGYMMKQTQEHMEALTALSMIQGDEGLKEKDILAQYGTKQGPFDPGKVDPLHNPRDPESQSEFISILKLIEEYYSPSRIKKLEEVVAAISVKTKGESRFATLVGSMLNVHETEKDFNKAFFASGMADELAQVIAQKNEPFGSRDKVEEVTRAVLKDKTDPSLHLVGGRQAVFDTIWGPKSASVVKKAAGRQDSIRSHGLTYHWNPMKTVQAQHEFPPYLAEVTKRLGPIMGIQTVDVKTAYEEATRALTDIIKAINDILPQDATPVAGLPKIREKQIDEIERNNKLLEEKMKYIREHLQQPYK